MNSLIVGANPDVLVVGGGIAGLSAALAAARAGAATILVDDRSRTVASPRFGQDSFRSHRETPPSCRELAATAMSAGVDIRTATSAWGCFAGLIICATDGSRTFSLRPRSLVLATGSYDVPHQSVGRQAASELARTAGCHVAYDPAGGFIPILDNRRQASVEGIYIAGDAAGPCEPEIAGAEGRLAGVAASAAAGFGSDSDVRSARGSLLRLAPDRLELPRATNTDTIPGDELIIVCPCEQVTGETVRAAISRGASSINDVKRRTRAGMGPCQGITCVAPIIDLLRELGQITYEAIEPMTARPPVRPLSLGQLATLDLPHQSSE